MKKKINGCAVIDIGSNDIRMGIYQIYKSNLITLDHLEYPLSLGHELFNFKSIDFSTISELNSIISKFKTVCAGFGITDIQAVSTTVMRESENCDIIADRVKIINNLDIRILSDNNEKSLIYYDIIQRLSPYVGQFKNAAIVYIGSGSMGICCFDGINITKSFTIPLGSVKLYDILSSLKVHAGDYHFIVEEYLNSVFSSIDLNDCDQLILTGTEMTKIADLCDSDENDGFHIVNGDRLNSLYNSIKFLTGENISIKYNLSEDAANMLSTDLSISHKMLNCVKKHSKLIIASTDMKKTIASKTLISSVKNSFLNHVYESSLCSAKNKAAKYDCNPKHYEKVRELCIKLFDKFKKLHGLDEKYRVFLEIAAILYDSGQYVNIRKPGISTFDLIKNSEVYGFNQADMITIAFTSCYDEFTVPSDFDPHFSTLSSHDKLLISKLVAIFRLACSLDKSQKGKITITTIKIEQDELVIKAKSSESSHLEEWAFNQCAEFFTKIYGIKPKLIVKSTII